MRISPNFSNPRYHRISQNIKTNVDNKLLEFTMQNLARIDGKSFISAITIRNNCSLKLKFVKIVKYYLR